MEYHVATLPKSETEILVTLSLEEFEPQVKRAAALISEKVEIEGFRKGKAPFDLVKNKVGEQAIYEEAAELAVKKTYPEVLQKVYSEKGSDFIPIGRPEITVTKLVPGNELQYKIKIALLPRVVLPDYREIARKVVRQKNEVRADEEEVAKTLLWIQDSRSPLVAVDRPAQKGDTVEIDFETRLKGVKIERGDAKNHPLVLGKGGFVPGFEDKLVDMRSGEEKSFRLPVPEDWSEKAFAGQELEFRVTMRSVQAKQKVELNDEFAGSLGKFSSLDSLKASIREGIAKEKAEKEKQRVRALIIEEISKHTQTEVPEVLVASELQKMLGELKSGIEGMGMKWEDYLLHIKKTPEELKKEWREEAEKRVQAALCLRSIANQENIEASEEEIQERANQFLHKFGTVEQAEKDIDPEGLKEYTKGIIRNEKVFELLESTP